MVLGRGAEFLDADLEAGKTYVVALLPPAAGTSDSFFALVPVREPGPAAVRQCREHCVWVENTDQSRAWSRRTWHSIQHKKLTYLPQWEARQPRPVLRAADGR
jgi:hypothetical protein